MQKYLLTVVAIACALSIPHQTWAGAGVNETTSLLTIRGAAGSYYSTVGGGSNERWAGKDLGQFDLSLAGDTLTLNNFYFENYAYNGGTTPAGASTNNNWLDGASTATFKIYRNSSLLQAVNLVQTSVSGNNRFWNFGSSPTTVNLLAGLTGSSSPITQTLSWTLDWTFYQYNGSTSTIQTQSTSAGDMTFQTIPEPSSASLMFLGSAALLALRRRKAA